MSKHGIHLEWGQGMEDRMQYLSKVAGCTPIDLIRRALAVYDLLLEEEAKGNIPAIIHSGDCSMKGMQYSRIELRP